MSARRLPEDHPAWKDLRPFGHECSKWLQAMAVLQNRWRKGRLGPGLAAFLESWMPQTAVQTELPETFEIEFAEGRLRGAGVLAPAGTPAWQALLHLPALREFWTAELRASHHGHLLKMVPPAWCLDPEPLPPGSVIAGLGLGGWDELSHLEAAGRRFDRQPAGENQVVLTELSAIGEGWRARYTHRDGQITLEDAFLPG